MSGIHNLTARWDSDMNGDNAWLARKPDVVIIAEPTSLDIVVAHRGVTRWKLQTSGRAAHSSKPAEGINAIYRMAEIVGHLQTYASQLENRSESHRLCGSPTLSVGRIEGGISVNVVPPDCSKLISESELMLTSKCSLPGASSDHCQMIGMVLSPTI